MQTTQHYAKILDRKVSEDMKMLKERIVSQFSVVNKKIGAL